MRSKNRSAANNALDTAGQVRSGEELDLTKLVPWLECNVTDLATTKQLGLPTVTQYSGGASNWTYCLSYMLADGAKKEVILRRAPAGTKAKGAHDMGREYR
jgi:aminoglycoside phosphotransferase (APT) family kinase protein